MIYKLAQVIPVTAGYKSHSITGYKWDIERLGEMYENFDEHPEIEVAWDNNKIVKGIDSKAIPLRKAVWDGIIRGWQVRYARCDLLHDGCGNQALTDRKGLAAWAHLMDKIAEEWLTGKPDDPGVRPQDPSWYHLDKEKMHRKVKSWESRKLWHDEQLAYDVKKALKDLHEYKQNVLKAAKIRKFKSFHIRM